MAHLTDKEVRILIEKLVPFESLIEVGYGNVFCPFHEDPKRSKSKSARFYFDDDGITRLHCWGEHRFFTAYDYMQLKMNVNPLTYLKDNFSQKEINDYSKVIKDLGLLKSGMNTEEMVTRIGNAWVDSYENINTFLDDIYNGYKMNEID